MSDTDLTVDDEDLEDVLPGTEAQRRRFTIGLFAVTLVASFVPVVTPLPLGYLLAVGVWVSGITIVYLVGYRRIQSDLDRELATVRRGLAGLAAAYLLYRVLRTAVRLLSEGPGPTVAEAQPIVLVVAAIVGIAAAVSAEPTRLVWFVASMFVLNALVTAGLGARLEFGDPMTALGAYLGLLLAATVLSYALVYRDVTAGLREGVT